MAARQRVGFGDVGSDQATYALGHNDIGAAIRVIVSYTDGFGTDESGDQRRDLLSATSHMPSPVT